MVAPNKQNFVRNHLVVVTLIPGKAEASLAIRPPDGKVGGLHPPRTFRIDALLKGGLTEEEALVYVLNVASAGLEGHERGNG